MSKGTQPRRAESGLKSRTACSRCHFRCHRAHILSFLSLLRLQHRPLFFPLCLSLKRLQRSLKESPAWSARTHIAQSALANSRGCCRPAHRRRVAPGARWRATAMGLPDGSLFLISLYLKKKKKVLVNTTCT